MSIDITAREAADRARESADAVAVPDIGEVIGRRRRRQRTARITFAATTVVAVVVVIGGTALAVRRGGSDQGSQVAVQPSTAVPKIRSGLELSGYKVGNCPYPGMNGCVGVPATASSADVVSAIAIDGRAGSKPSGVAWIIVTLTPQASARLDGHGTFFATIDGQPVGVMPGSGDTFVLESATTTAWDRAEAQHLAGRILANR